MSEAIEKIVSCTQSAITEHENEWHFRLKCTFKPEVEHFNSGGGQHDSVMLSSYHQPLVRERM